MAMPLHDPGSLMTLDEWMALPEDNTYRYELQEGVLLASPRPAPRHQQAAYRLVRQFDDQLPSGWDFLLDVEVVVRAEYPPRSFRWDRATSTSTSSRASTRRQESRITGSSTLTRLPRRSPCSTWVRRMMATSRARRPPVSSSRRRPSACTLTSPRWSPRVSSPPNTKDSPSSRRR